MASAIDFPSGNPAGAAELEAMRRRHAHDGVYGFALVVGCLVGIGLSWQTVLSEGARERLVASLFGVAAETGTGSRPAADAPTRPAGDMIALAAAPPAIEPSPALKSPLVLEAMPQRGAGRSAELPERLLLDEEDKPAAAQDSLATTEIVFAMNSSFLLPGDYSELRRLASALPEEAVVRVAIAATVSDEPLRNGDVEEAGRYNRWLAERRAERVAEWLRRRIGDRATIEIDLLPHDPTRRVTVDIRPAA